METKRNPNLLYACIAVLGICLACVVVSYFNSVSRVAEASQMRDATQFSGQILQNQNDYWKKLEDTNRPTSTAASEPPARLPEYRTPGTSAPASTP